MGSKTPENTASSHTTRWYFRILVASGVNGLSMLLTRSTACIVYHSSEARADACVTGASTEHVGISNEYSTRKAIANMKSPTLIQKSRGPGCLRKRGNAIYVTQTKVEAARVTDEPVM
eukprot:CAMPEP_0180111060 /NCGR_PEP_ID=MMETSP0985-20121206/35393_1 /TAXON_ID=483367 /ORGANISM="non described non described, Strain CCMP 2436" /LENGTH=117 /DNA_ID=CAMNT_0022049163 /DNA_START=399 /DNA_END=752 /DNA_ORIENTATION=+